MQIFENHNQTNNFDSKISLYTFHFREIMHEIQRLRIEQEIHAKNTAEAQYNPTLMAELRLLRQRKDELENRMQALQESRKDLVMQLESLMKLLKVLKIFLFYCQAKNIYLI